MNIAFVCYTNFVNNSAIQMFHLANALVDRGHSVKCVVPGPIETVANCGVPRFTILDRTQVMEGRADAMEALGSIDLVHAWTPREGVRKTVNLICSRVSCPYFVHLEDNEDYVSASFLGIGLDELLGSTDEELRGALNDNFSFPQSSRSFLARSAGVSVLIEPLAEFVPEGLRSIVFYPSCNEATFRPSLIDYKKRRTFGIADDDFLIVYNGNAHFANKDDMKSLYLAVGLVNVSNRTRKVRLLRVGSTVDVDLYGQAERALKPYIVDLGSRPHSEQPGLLALADGLVQPGRPGKFNDYRFPSKLPEFFRMEKPVILPRSNIGLQLVDRVHCLLLNEGSAFELSERIGELVDEPDLCERVVTNMTQFSKARLSWKSAAESLVDLYRSM